MKYLTNFGVYVEMTLSMFRKPENKRMYWNEFIQQCNDIGVQSLGIVSIVSIFIGAVSAIQTAYQLTSPLIPKIIIAQIIRDTVILEFSPTLICVILAGVVGSRIAGELGNMRVSEQVDALETMGVNSKSFLIGPKVLASLFTIPLLVIISMALGIYGGRLACVSLHIISADTFDRGLTMSFRPYNVWFAIVKGYVFAYLISTISSFYGYYVKGGAVEIGQNSTKAVVWSCVSILFADYILSALLL